MSITADGTTQRGTTNGNVRGNSEDRRRRREWLVETYRADVTAIRVTYVDHAMPHLATLLIGVTETFVPRPLDYASVWALWHRIQDVHGYVASIEAVPLCRCYRCGRPLSADTVTVDRIIPGCQGGTYRRNNIRPACSDCNSETGGALSGKGRRR